MSGALKFSDLTKGGSEDLPEKTEKGIEIEIEVAGPKAYVTRTIKLSLDNRGLIKLSFKEGGIMPPLLAGRFTDIENVKTVLAVWKDREAKNYNLDEKVNHPNKEGKNISEIVDEEVQVSAAPGFEEKLDDVLAESDNGMTFEDGDVTGEDDNSIVMLS